MTPFSHRSLAVATALIATAGLAACSGDKTPLPAEIVTSPTVKPMSTVAVDPVLADLVGPGCADYVAQVPRGDGSVAGMAGVPLATAARRAPLLTTLSSAVSGKLNPKVKLGQTLNGNEYTVFAPVDAAFAALPGATTTNWKSDSEELIKVLTHHLVVGRLAPKRLTGAQISVAGGKIMITGSGNALMVDDAKVICGGIKTANATVYLIDKVLSVPE